MSELDSIIAPEIKNDRFYAAILRLSSSCNIKTILEIGSSSGQGSTEAFVRGIALNPKKPALYCMELSKPRFDELRRTYQAYDFVHCYNVSSVETEKFPSEEEVRKFYSQNKTGLNAFSLEQVLSWLRQDLEYVKNSGTTQNGISTIKRETGIQDFDMVLIDGSEFTGKSELDQVYGAKYILLDDVNTFKNFENRKRLLSDSQYKLIEEDLSIRNGYSIFERVEDQLPIHFFTIVLNGEPFIRQHIEVLKQLNFAWHWHIIEGVADLKHDTAWSLAQGGRIPSKLHNCGLSIDGTTAYLDSLATQYPNNISIYRKPKGEFWDGKKEMVSAPLSHIKAEALLWQLDCDEIWNAQQITTMQQMFCKNPQKTAAWFWCWYYVGPEVLISSRNCYAQNPKQEWLRVWRFKPSMYWEAHEPPRLVAKNQDGNPQDVGSINPFFHFETEAQGLVFHHLSYVFEQQLEFKESYYGYKGALAAWQRLQEAKMPARLADYLPWVQDYTMVDKAQNLGVQPVKIKSVTQTSAKLPKGNFKLVIDGVFFQLYQTGISRVWSSLLREWSKTPFAKNIVVLDRNNTAPKYAGINYRPIPSYAPWTQDVQAQLLEQVCREEGADLFASTYYTKPITTKSVQMVYDMIPEVFNFNMPADTLLNEKPAAFDYASAYVCISEHSRQDLFKHYAQSRSLPNYVVYPAYDPECFYPAPREEILSFLSKYSISKPYFLMVGPARGYKNLELFLAAFAKLPSLNGFEAVLVGGHLEAEELKTLAGGLPVKHLKLSDAELRAAYSAALALVFPSRYEGFGLPILESMACGCPVITTTFSSIPEVAGKAAIYIKDQIELADALCEVQKPSVQAKFVALGKENVKRFSWAKAADELRQIFQDLAVQKELPAELYSGSDEVGQLFL